MHRPADAGDIVAEVSQVAATSDSPVERATALLEPLLESLHRLLPFDGAWLALRDEHRSGHRSLVSTGWDRRTAAYLDGLVLVNEMAFWVKRSRAQRIIDNVPVYSACKRWRRSS